MLRTPASAPPVAPSSQAQSTLTLRYQSLKRGGVKPQTKNEHGLGRPHAPTGHLGACKHWAPVSIWAPASTACCIPPQTPHPAPQGMQVAMGLYRQPGQHVQVHLSFPALIPCRCPPLCPAGHSCRRSRRWVQQPRTRPVCGTTTAHLPFSSPLPTANITATTAAAGQGVVPKPAAAEAMVRRLTKY